MMVPGKNASLFFSNGRGYVTVFFDNILNGDCVSLIAVVQVKLFF